MLTDLGAPLKLMGTASIDQCLGMSSLHVMATGVVTDGTQYMTTVAIRPYPAEPAMSDWFTMTKRHGETVVQGIDLGTLSGFPAVTVSDDQFNVLLTGNC